MYTKSFFLKTRSKNTWYPIIYITYGILNDFKAYEDTDFIHESLSMVSVLKNISAVNINKLAGKSISNYDRLSAIFSANKELPKKQIDLLNPDIIIGGNTLKYYKDLLRLSELKHSISAKGTNYYFDNEKLYIDAYHPSRIGIERYKYVNEDYIEDIIFIARIFFLELWQTK
jgi:hypothetical protein